MNDLVCFVLSILVIVQLFKEGGAEDVANDMIDVPIRSESPDIDFGYEGSDGILGYPYGKNNIQRPSFWGKKYSHCYGKHQSPIDIEEHDVKVVDMVPITYTNFDQEGELHLTNNGHTVLIQINASISIEGGPLNAKYLFVQMHFHWGANNSEGSENRINNRSYPMELHMVFYSANYGQVREALDHPGGLCVLSFLFSTRADENPNYSEIINALPIIQERMSKTRLDKPLALDSLLPDKSHYFTYEGSLTTPPCAEVVTWIEYQRTIPLSAEQVDAFRHLRSGRGILAKNFRPLQKLHGRIIRSNRDIQCTPLGEKNSSSTDRAYNLSQLILVLFIFYINYD